MKGKIIALIGISASGKSSWAHQFWSQSSLNRVVISRDKIRNLLFNYNDNTISGYYKRDDFNKLEKEVSRFQDSLIYDALELGKTVILDNTNLNRQRDLEKLKYWNVPTELVFFDVDLQEAVYRDIKRTRTVGIDIINKQYNRFNQLKKDLEAEPIDFTPITLNNDESKSKAICLDLDGTACKMNGRSPYEWNRVGEDLPDESVLTLIKNLNRNNIKLIICTGRDGVCIDETEQWLFKHGVDYDEIYIRAKGDSRPDWVVKEEFWRQISKDYYISFLVDDRLQVCRRARALGLKVFNVEHGNF